MRTNALNLKNTSDLRPLPPKPRLSVRKGRQYLPPTRWLKFATEMLRLPTSPFHEQNVLLWLWRFGTHRGLAVHRDDAGNLQIDYVPAQMDPAFTSAPRLMFTAHVDHTGFWAVEMVGPTTLRAQWMGRFPEELIAGSRVMFWTGGKPVSEVEPAFWPGASELMRIGGRRVGGRVTRVLNHNVEGDVAGVEIEVEETVQPGSIGMWDLPDPQHTNGKLYARGIDDVCGAASLVCLLDTMIRERSPRPVSMLFTRGEEGGFFGAIRYCRRVFDSATTNTSPPSPSSSATSDKPAVIISVETSKALPHAPHNHGPVVRVGDRQTLFKPELAVWAAACAAELASEDPTFVYQRELMDGGTCESTVFQAWMGNAGALCIPLGNYHNYNAQTNAVDSEFVATDDFGNLVRLMKRLVDRSEGCDQTFRAFKQWAVDWEARHAELFSDPSAVPTAAQALPAVDAEPREVGV